ncbi:Uncharacterized protein Fot_53193 [Forsythia ovata]|uniref:Uncharacterized protein n=1 Tax=Forsythia ovata TaxID=205694 RepID=A0ABD1PIR9_9LAMI
MESANKLVESSNSRVSLLSENFKDLKRIVTRRDSAIAAANDIQDICGYSTKKVHAILTYNGTNHLIKKEVPCETDQLTHVYTFMLRPDATYNILVDNVEKQTGCLYSNWDLLPPMKIKNPEVKKAKSSDTPTVESGSEAEEIASPKVIRNYSHLRLIPVCEEDPELGDKCHSICQNSRITAGWSNDMLVSFWLVGGMEGRCIGLSIPLSEENGFLFPPIFLGGEI